MKFFRQTFESFRFAWQALRSNLLRTTLSLLGVTVGIFAIVAVFTVVDSLERNIRDSLAFIGDKVIYVQKMPWSFSADTPWWKYFQRPEPTYNEFRFLSNRLESAQAIVAQMHPEIDAHDVEMETRVSCSSFQQRGASG